MTSEHERRQRPPTRRVIDTVICCALTATLIVAAVQADDSANSSGLGADYAMLSLMAVSPDFAAANYTIENDGPGVTIRTGRFPFRFDLGVSGNASYGLELTLAFQRAEEVLDNLSPEGGSIDSTWDTYGASIGLIHERELAHGFYLAPSLRLGVTETRNDAVYEEFESDQLRDLLDGTFLNWRSRAGMVEVGLGAGYRFRRLDRTSRIESTLSHARVESFDESDDTLAFVESVNLLSTVLDAIYPTRLEFLDERLDLVLLGAHHRSFGENSRTLGYTDSYQAGIGVERPLNVGGSVRRYVRVSAQVLWAETMDGWLLSVALDRE